MVAQPARGSRILVAAPASRRERTFVAIKITVNATSHTLDVEPEMPLLWALRETLGLTGTKYGCGIAACGACTVHLDGRAVRSCVLPISAADGKSVTTIEGLAQGGTLHKVQQAWVAHQVPQCGYCQSGMIMAVAGLLAQKPAPTDEDIDTGLTNICRCGTFARVRAAIHAAVKERATS
jgi:isoquinoline 1-oxidoreductase alpha subunit